MKSLEEKFKELGEQQNKILFGGLDSEVMTNSQMIQDQDDDDFMETKGDGGFNINQNESVKSRSI